MASPKVIQVLEHAVVTASEVFIPLAFVAGNAISAKVVLAAAGAGLSVAYNTVLKPWIDSWSASHAPPAAP